MSGSESAIEIVNHGNQVAIAEFVVGSEVEVRSDDDGFKGAWFRATIVDKKKKRKKVLVEYYTLLTDEGFAQLRELVDLMHVRPLPPAIGCLSFEVGDVVDADHLDGWWIGVVKKVLGNSRFRVFFDNPPDIIEFHQNQMRYHQDWIKGRWVRPKREPQMTGSHFSPGNDVEVNLESVDSCTAWIPAIVVTENKDNTFLVNYHIPKPKHWGNTVDFLHIRPPAPRHADRVYNLHDAVDAFYDFAWRPAQIVTMEGENSYTVSFQNGTRSKELTRAEIRPQLEWKCGEWVIDSKVFQEATRNSNANLQDGSERVSNNINNCEAEFLQDYVRVADDKLENETSQPKHPEENPMDQCIDLNTEPVSSVETPNTTKTTSTEPYHRVRIKRLPKRSQNGVPDKTLEAATSSLGKMESAMVWATEVSGSSKRSRKPVIPFNFESFTGKRVRSKRRSLEVEQTSPAKRKGRPRKNPEKSPEASAVDKANNETNVTTENADEKDSENHSETPVRSTSTADEIQGLLAKVPPQFFSKELETGTINTKNKSDNVEEYNGEVVSAQLGSDPILADLLHSLAVFPNTESEQPQADRSSKRKRGRPRKFAVFGLESSDGVAHVDDTVINACPTSAVASPAQPAETTDSKEVIKRKKTDISTSKSSKKTDVSTSKSSKKTDDSTSKSLINEGVPIPDSMDDDDRPLATWLDAVQAQTGTEPKSLVKTAEQENKEMQPTPAEESLAIVGNTPEKTPKLPFAKSSPIWNVVESLDVFTKMPQTPHFRPLYKCKEECREGLAIGNMVTFSGLVSKIAGLKLDDQNSVFTSTLESLLDLEKHGFDVSALRSRVNDLLSIKAKQERIRNNTKDSESKIARCTDDKTKLVEEIDDVAKKIEALREKHELIRVQIEIKDIEISKLQENLDVANRIVDDARVDFEKLRSAPVE